MIDHRRLRRRADEAMECADSRSPDKGGADDDDRDRAGHGPVAGFDPFHMRTGGDDPEQDRDDRHGLATDALPVAAAKVQEHPELVERQAEADAIEQACEMEHFPRRPDEEGERPYHGQQDDAIIQVMDVSSIHMEVKLGNLIGRDQVDRQAGDAEGDQEGT